MMDFESSTPNNITPSPTTTTCASKRSILKNYTPRSIVAELNNLGAAVVAGGGARESRQQLQLASTAFTAVLRMIKVTVNLEGANSAESWLHFASMLQEERETARDVLERADRQVCTRRAYQQRGRPCPNPTTASRESSTESTIMLEINGPNHMRDAQYQSAVVFSNLARLKLLTQEPWAAENLYGLALEALSGAYTLRGEDDAVTYKALQLRLSVLGSLIDYYVSLGLDEGVLAPHYEECLQVELDLLMEVSHTSPAA